MDGTASPYLTTVEAQEFLRYRSLSGFRKAVRRLRIPYLRRGKIQLFLKTDLIRVWKAPVGYRPRKSGQDATL
jgi:hypothetical protein